MELSQNENITAIELNSLLKCYVNRNAIAIKDNLFENLVNKHVRIIIGATAAVAEEKSLNKKEKTEHGSLMSSRLIKDTCFIFQSTNGLVPELMDHLIKYVVENQSFIFADTCARVLHLCYHLGYNPNQNDADRFFEASFKIIER